jgi:uncharacterized protein (TIGR02594 family)
MKYIIPPWMAVLEREYRKSVKEIPGSRHNPDILKYHASTTLKATTDEVPWCSSFENYIIRNCGLGYAGTGSAAALSWLKWGKTLAVGRYGCIVVFDHGGGKGHVCNYLYESQDGNYVFCIGGNQSDAITIAKYTLDDVADFRWPNSFAEVGGYG